ncbi:MAG: hypothetical protein AB7F25_06430 [Deferribacterales bacterium]
MIRKDNLFPYFLIVVAIIVAVMQIIISSQRQLTSLENTLLQLFSLLSGLIGSYFLGKYSSTESAKEIIKPHARSAFRRLMSLYASLSRVAIEISNSKEYQSKEITLERMEVIVIEQLATADDALEDWKDLVPDEIEELSSKLKSLKHMENSSE